MDYVYEIEMLISGTDRLADFIQLNNIDVVIFSDKSARYIRPLLEARILLRNPDAPLPQFCFINVGTEKQTSFGFSEEYLDNSEVIEQLRNGLAPFIGEKSRLCVVDEFASSGDSLKNCKNIVKRAFPDKSVRATYAFDDEPFWTPYDALKDVVDTYELGREEDIGRIFTRGVTQTLKNQKYTNIQDDIDPNGAQNARLLRTGLRYLASKAPVSDISPENKHPFIPKYIDHDIWEELVS